MSCGKKKMGVSELEALKTNFNNFQRRDDMSSMTQAELECWIGQYERLYKKHVMLAEVKAKGKVVKVLRTDLDNIRDEINLIEKKLKKKAKAKHLEEKNGLLESHNQMIDSNNNKLNGNNMFLLEKLRSMDE
jgi:5-bromo-4-chloroindolyl phosphate hydrolysis protein